MEMDQKGAQEKALMYQILQAQMDELSKQAVALENRMVELEAAEASLKEVNGSKEGSDMLVPMGAGCYGYGKLSNKDKFLVEIGAGLVKEQGLKDALKNVDAKKAEVEDAARKLKMEIDHIRGSMDRIGLELQEFQKQAMSGADKKEGRKGDSEYITVD